MLLPTNDFHTFTSVIFDLMESQNSVSITEKIIDVTGSIQLAPFDETRLKLISLINELINKDFDAVVQLLYRIDVSEKKVRDFLDQNTGRDSASILADLIIERQLQKIASRKHFSQRSGPGSEEERWE